MGGIPSQRLGRDDSDEQSLDVWARVQRVQAGDMEAFGPIYSLYVGKIFRYVLFRVGNRPLAEDLTSETFAKALRSIGSFTWQGRDFGAWLNTIARNLIADHFKSGRYRLEVTLGDVCADAGETSDDRVYMQPEASTLESMDSAALLKLVAGLKGDQRLCIELRFLRQLSVAETAEAMGKNQGAIKALTYRAMRSLTRVGGSALAVSS